MPIYEFYCPDNHTIYQFYAKTLAQGKLTPRCPANPKWEMKKLVSAFAVTSGGKKDEAQPGMAGSAGKRIGGYAKNIKKKLGYSSGSSTPSPAASSPIARRNISRAVSFSALCRMSSADCPRWKYS